MRQRCVACTPSCVKGSHARSTREACGGGRGAHLHRALVLPVGCVEDPRRGVEVLADAVADEGLPDGERRVRRVRADRAPDLAEVDARPAHGDAGVQSGLRARHEVLRAIAHVPDEERPVDAVRVGCCRSASCRHAARGGDGVV